MAYISSGCGSCGTGTAIDCDNGWETTSTADCDCQGPTVWVVKNYGDWPVKHLGRIHQAIDVPWLFDYDEPWTAPNHYPPAPQNIQPRKSAPRITNHIIKQPGPMRRGNRICQNG